MPPSGVRGFDYRVGRCLWLVLQKERKYDFGDFLIREELPNSIRRNDDERIILTKIVLRDFRHARHAH